MLLLFLRVFVLLKMSKRIDARTSLFPGFFCFFCEEFFLLQNHPTTHKSKHKSRNKVASTTILGEE